MRKILIIEDNHEMRDNLTEILELANYKVISTDNGKDGFEQVLQQTPDLVLCDISMPVLDGYGVLHLMQKNETSHNTPFIFLTARSDKNDIRKGMNLGADDYITKPFNESELLQAVEARLKKSDAIKQHIENNSGNNNTPATTDTEQEVLSFLTENRNINTYRNKQIIYTEGNRPSRLFYIQKGKVKTYRQSGDGKQLITALLSEGQFLGYAPLMEGSCYKDTAEAIENVELGIIPKPDFDDLLNTSKYATRYFSTLLAQNVSQKEDALVGLAYNSLRKKVAETLLHLSTLYQGDINISRANFAAIAGTAPESVVRTLNDFKEEKLIGIKNAIIIILNKNKLLNMVN